MGPPRGPSNKSSSSKGKTGKSKSGSSASAPSSRVSKNKAKLPPPKQQKTRSTDTGPKKKKQRVYTAEELGVPTLNMITPAGVEKPKGKKKGKVFVDDQESMLTILAMVNADKEGQIESKMMRARQMEEIREARKKEAEAREQQRKDKLESTKDSIRRKRRRRDAEESTHQDAAPSKEKHSSRKRVSFA